MSNSRQHVVWAILSVFMQYFSLSRVLLISDLSNHSASIITKTAYNRNLTILKDWLGTNAQQLAQHLAKLPKALNYQPTSAIHSDALALFNQSSQKCHLYLRLMWLMPTSKSIQYQCLTFLLSMTYQVRRTEKWNNFQLFLTN